MPGPTHAFLSPEGTIVELNTLLKDPALLRLHAYIDGQWCEADSGASFGVIDPATGATLGSVPLMGETETSRAIDTANAAWPAWRAARTPPTVVLKE